MDLSHLCILCLSPHHTVVFLAAIHRICEMLCCGKQGVALGLAPANLREGVKKKLVKSGQADRLGRQGGGAIVYFREAISYQIG